MLIIAHRGCTEGPDEKENEPNFIDEALKKFYCEIDLWKIQDSLFLGHDYPKYKITENDFVYTKEGEFMEVLETHNFKDKELLQIEFDDGYKVTCTPEHKFFIDGVWIEAKDLVVDDEVCCI